RKPAALAELPPTSLRRLILFLGSNIGNFESGGAAGFLRAVRGAMSARDTFLLGLDLVKAEADLVAAYDDAQGVTARFTCNLLVRANRELGADFDPSAFRHFARWNAEYERMEMGLLALRDSVVHVAGREFAFTEGEEIHTEYSRKYTRASAERLAREAGFRIARWWTDGAGRFADALLEPTMEREMGS
ncbi:L-histidine N(alpha)-methyltransferase, partial [bacterium]